MKSVDETARSLGTVNPEVIRNYRFATAFRGYDTSEVRAFLNKVADAVTTYSENASAFVLSVAEGVKPSTIEESAATAEQLADEDPAAVEQARADADSIIAAAKDEANAIVARANDEAARIFLRARAESRGKPSADTMAAVEAALAETPTDPSLAKEQARIMISEAKAVRERILTDLAKRRRVAHVQLEQLRVAREKLLESFRDARRVADEASRGLSTAEVEARLAAETAGRRVGAEDLPTVAELEAELFSGRSLLPSAAPRPQAGAATLGGSSPVTDDLDGGRNDSLIVAAPVVPDVEAAEGSAGAATDYPPVPERAAAEASVQHESDRPEETPEATISADVTFASKESASNDDEAGPVPAPAVRVATVDDLFARLRRDREIAAAAAHELLDGKSSSKGVAAKPPGNPTTNNLSSKGSAAEPSNTPSRDNASNMPLSRGVTAMPDSPSSNNASSKGSERSTRALGDVLDRDPVGPDGSGVGERSSQSGTAAPDLMFVDLTAFDSEVLTDATFDPEGTDGFRDDMITPLPLVGVDAELTKGRSAEFDFVIGTLQAQCTRAMKRFLQDEQSRALAALRTARGRVSLDDLLGDAETRQQRLGDTVRTFLRDAYRAGADLSAQSVHDDSVAAELKNLETALTSSVTSPTGAAMDTAMNSDFHHQGQTLSDLVGEVYRSWPSERLSGLVAEHLGAAFHLGPGRVH